MKAILPIILFLLFGLQGAAQIPTVGLIAHYPFCGNANDLSGNGLNGNVNGASLVADRFGNASRAYGFDGINDYISLPPASFIGMDVYSFSLWIRPLSGAVAIPYSIGSNDPYCQSLSFNTTSISAGSYNVGNNPVQSYVFSNTLPGLNTWIHAVVTRDQNILRLYVNGLLVSGTVNMSSTNNQSADYGSTLPYRAILGARSTLAGYFFNGEIDDVRIYSTVLNQADVTALYNEPNTFAISVASGSVCPGSSFTLNPSGATSYTYSGGSAIVSPTITTSYTITGIGSCGQNSAVATVVVPNPPIITVNNGSVCPGNSYTFNPSGALSYTYSGGSAVVNPISTTNYTITGTNGCGAGSTVATVFILPTPTVNINGPFVICSGQTTVLTATGANTYNWSSNATSPTITVSPTLALSNYSVVGTNTAGCSATASFSILVDPCTGIDGLVRLKNNVTIQPNPNSGHFTIHWNATDKKGGIFVLQDLQGKTLKTFNLDYNNELTEVDIELPSGCYIGKLTVNGKIIYIGKIVIVF